MTGITNLKKMIDVGLNFAADFRTILADKKFQLSELFLLVDNFSGITEIVQNWSLVAAEWKDLDAAERLEMNAYFSQKFDIPNDKIEEFIELALTNIVSLIALVEKFKALRNPA